MPYLQILSYVSEDTPHEVITIVACPEHFARIDTTKLYRKWKPQDPIRSLSVRDSEDMYVPSLKFSQIFRSSQNIFFLNFICMLNFLLSLCLPTFLSIYYLFYLSLSFLSHSFHLHSCLIVSQRVWLTSLRKVIEPTELCAVVAVPYWLWAFQAYVLTSLDLIQHHIFILCIFDPQEFIGPCPYHLHVHYTYLR